MCEKQIKEFQDQNEKFRYEPNGTIQERQEYDMDRVVSVVIETEWI